MKLSFIFLLLALRLLSLGVAHGSSVSIALEDPEFKFTAARDLEYAGSAIDHYQAMELKKAGMDLSELNPKASNLWQDQSLPLENYAELDYPESGATLNFFHFRSSPTDFFRATVGSNGKFYNLMASLHNHTTILRAGLLRKMGFDIDAPKYYSNLKINFSDLEEKKLFMDTLSEQTLTKKTRWILEDNEEEKHITLKGVILSPTRLKNVNIHIPVMERERQTERRIFRGLIDIYALTDFGEKVNMIGWQTGRIFNKTLMLTHPYAGEFTHTTIDDMRWFHRQLTSKVSREDLYTALRLSGFPESFAEVLTEKLVSRINGITQMIALPNKFLYAKPNLKVSNKYFKNGKLIKDIFTETALETFEDDPENPYRFGEIFRLFRTQLTYNALSGLMDTAISKFVPGITANDAMETINEKIRIFRSENPGQQGEMPLKLWATPTANGRIFANRNIVFGQFLNSNATIQLVDSVGADVNLGGFGQLTSSLQNITPTFGLNATLSRSYIHVRAMPDLKTASSQAVKKLLVPNLMKKIGRVLNPNPECGIPKEPYVEEDEVADSTIYIIKYDSADSDGRTKALTKRQELIDSGIEEGKILLERIDREALCITEIKDGRKKSIEEFLKEFAENETFIINDQIRVNQRTNLNYIAPIPMLSASVGNENSVAMLRLVIIRKVGESLEVTLQHQRNLRTSFDEGLSYFIELMRNTTRFEKGNMVSHVYKIPLSGLNEEEQIKAAAALQELLVSNNHDKLKEFDPIKLNHEIKSRLNTFRTLMFKFERLRMNHHLEITLPESLAGEYEQSRSFFTNMVVKRNGQDIYSFLDRMLNQFVGFLSLGANDGDPGFAFLGTSSRKYYVTEAEVSENFELNPVSKIQLSHAGWKIKPKKLLKLIDNIEELYQGLSTTPIVDRSLFNGIKEFRSYDIKNTIIVYPPAIEKLLQLIAEPNTKRKLNIFYTLYGPEEWQRFCQRADDFFGDNGPQAQYIEGEKYCVPSSVTEIMHYQKKLNTNDKEDYVIAINKMIFRIFEDFSINRVLKWIGDKNYFANVRVTGFRTQHAEGYTDYISHTIGTYSETYKTGMLDHIGARFSLSPYELRALNYTPGM